MGDDGLPAAGANPERGGRHRRPQRFATLTRVGQVLTVLGSAVRVGEWLEKHDAPTRMARAIVDCYKALRDVASY